MSTPIGIIVAFVGIIGAMVLEGSSPAELVSEPAPMLLVFLGTMGASMASVNMSDVGGAFKAAIKAMKGSKSNAAAVVEELVGFADTARREGLLALEEKVKGVEDEFLKRALEQVIDGSDPEAVEDTLHAEIDALKKRHTVAQKFWADAGAFAPTIGIIGTVIGLVQVLQRLEDPTVLGPLVAGAFVATLWGVLSANFFWLPMAAKIRRNSDLRAAQMSLLIEGVSEIVAGTNPRALRAKLRAKLPPSEAQVSAA